MNRNPLYLPLIGTIAILMSLFSGFEIGRRTTAPVFSISTSSTAIQPISYTCWTPDRLESFQLTVEYSTASPHWAFTDCTYLSERLSGGRTVIQVDVGASGIPVVQAWPDGITTQYSSAGIAEFAMGPSNCDPAAGRTGALTIYIDSRSKSDAITGMCLPLNRHVVFILSLRQTTVGPTPTPTATFTPTPSGPTPTTGPAIYVTRDQFNALIDLLTKALNDSRLP